MLKRSDPKQVAEEELCYKGICPKCEGKIILFLITANDGCWSEHFECTNCDYIYPNQSMSCQQHQKEVSQEGRIVSGIKEITNREHYVLKVGNVIGCRWNVLYHKFCEHCVDGLCEHPKYCNMKTKPFKKEKVEKHE